jgi:hypothetical protein
VALQKYFSHPSLVIFFSPTPSIKLIFRLQMDGRLLIATLLDESIQPYQQQVLSFAVPFTSLSNQTNTQSTAVGKLCCAFHQPQSNTQSTAGVKFCCSFYQPRHHVQKCWAKTILLRHVLTFLRSIFLSQGHILSLSGAALSSQFHLSITMPANSPSNYS